MYFETNHQSSSRSFVSMPLEQYTAMDVENMVAQRVADLERTILGMRVRQQQLEASANHDPLTGLANRNLLQDRFCGALERAKRNNECFALLMIDLNGFKVVNDTYGHGAGDEVLITVSQRLVAAVRTCDAVARLGGDEFVIIIESVQDPLVIAKVNQNLCKTVSDAFHLISGEVVSIGASIGASIYPQDGTNLAQMMAVADKKMYRCKPSSQFGRPAMTC